MDAGFAGRGEGEGSETLSEMSVIDPVNPIDLAALIEKDLDRLAKQIKVRQTPRTAQAVLVFKSDPLVIHRGYSAFVESYKKMMNDLEKASESFLKPFPGELAIRLDRSQWSYSDIWIELYTEATPAPIDFQI